MKTSRDRNIRKLLFAGTGAFALAIFAADTQAARATAPSNGAPFVANNYASFTYLNGMVLHTNPSLNDGWMLTSLRDTSSSINGSWRAVVTGRTGGGAGQTLDCQGIVTTQDGASTLGSFGSISAGCTGTIGTVTTPLVAVTGNSSFVVFCTMPPAVSCSSQLASFTLVGN